MRARVLLLVIISIFISTAVSAKEIAVINLEEIAKGSTSLRKFNENLEREKNEIQNLIRKKEEELGKKKEELESKASILTKDSLQAKALEFQNEVLAFQDSVRQEEIKLQEKLNEALTILNGKINEIVTDMIKEEKYSKYSFVSSTVVFVYYDKDDDITMEVLKRLNKREINLSNSKQRGKKK
jgi:Skp family chaperone for outer membrane proteins